MTNTAWRRSRWAVWFLLIGGVATHAVFGGPFDEQRFPAFPGAEGAGAYTRGGRGGKLLFVTTLDDYDPRREKPIAGSLRAAIDAQGPRIVLFRVAGNIELTSDLDVNQPYLTIAAQTAPGDGVCLKNASLKINAPQVVVRYLRVRPGDVQRRELDCISCREQQVILDHCSASWGIDETISTNGNSANVTVQWCMIVESLNHSVHHKGSHGYGSLISGPGEITYHHNVYAFHRSRSPRGGDVLLDFRNNLIYGWGDRAGYSGSDRLMMNYVGNFLQPLGYSKLKTVAFSPGGLEQRLYLAGNVFQGSPAGTENNWLLVKPPNDATADRAEQALRANREFAVNTVSTDSARDAREKILREVGAALPARDGADCRVLEDIRRGSGRLIDSQTEVGGWPTLQGGEPPADADADGMPDAWETKFGLDSQAAQSSSSDADGDGYPDVEEYLNGTDPRAADPWLAVPGIVSSAGDAFLGATTVTIAGAPDGAGIRYTLDESEPTGTSPLYRGPIVLDRSATVRTKAFLGQQASHVRNARLSRLTMHDPLAVENPRPGVRYTYYERLGDADLATFEKAAPAKSGITAAIGLDPRNREEDFGFRFDGLLEVPSDGIYTFTLRCSPRGRLDVAGQPVVESQGRKRERAGKIALKRGLHAIGFAIYYPAADDKTLEIDFEGPGFSRRPLSGGRLFCAGE